MSFFISSCFVQGEKISILDNDILRNFHESHKIPFVGDNGKPTFKQFMEDVVYQREDVDVNEDGKKEILLSGSISFPKWSFFSIYQLNTSNQWTEIYFLESHGWYDSLVQQKYSSPYIFVDFLESWGGTGLFSVAIDRHFIRCEQDICDSISFPYYYERRSGNGVQSSWAYSNSRFFIAENQVEIKSIGYSISNDYKVQEVCDLWGNLMYSETPQPTYTVDTRIAQKYVWDNGKFTETDHKEIPSFDIKISSEIYGDRDVAFMIASLAGENATPQQQIEIYNEFFGISDYNSNFPITLPCLEIKRNENLIWFPKNIMVTNAVLGEKNFRVAVSKECNMVIWSENKNDNRKESLEQISFIAKRKIDSCNPNFLSFQWINITQSELPELVITSGFLNKTVWFFDIEDNAKLVYQAKGIVRDESMMGVDVQLIDEHIILTIGLPYHKQDCLTSFECFLLEKEHETYIWDNSLQEFILQQ